jgi:hypothetical protein
VSRLGSVEIDWPRSAGYFGGIGLAVGLGIIDPPLAIFLAAVPLVKMLDQPGAALPVRLVSQVYQGAAKPVGGDSEATVRVPARPGGGGGPSFGGMFARFGREATSMVQEAREKARGPSDGSV